MVAGRGAVSPRGKALELLARRAHFRAELATKLAARGFDDDEVAETLDRLVAEGLVDDSSTARAFAEERFRRGPVGARRLAAELRRRGAGDDAVATALALLPEDDLAAALAAATRGPQGDPAAVARRLERRGFSRRAIFAVLRRLGADGLDADVPDVDAEVEPDPDSDPS